MTTRPNAPLLVSLAAIAIIALMAAFQAPALLRTSFGAGVGSPMGEGMIERVETLHKEEMETFRARFDGRSAFFKPRKRLAAPPPRVEAAPVDDGPREPIDTGPQPASATYKGPSIIAIVGDIVWFFDGTILSVGESAGAMKVVATNAPRTATIEYTEAGHEMGSYDVPIFDQFPESTWGAHDFLLSGDEEATRPTLPGLVESEGDGAEGTVRRIPPSTNTPAAPAPESSRRGGRSPAEGDSNNRSARPRPPVRDPGERGSQQRGGSRPEGDSRS